MPAIYFSREWPKLNFLKTVWKLLWLYFQQNKKYAALELKYAPDPHPLLISAPSLHP